MSHPKISVLVPVYNGEKFLREALQSILNQSFRDFEIIAIDDGSSDGTWGILLDFASKDSRIKLLRNDENLGLSKTLSRGFQECQGEYFVRHDADDISLPHRFERQVDFLNRNPQTGAVGTMTEYIDGEGKFLGKQHQAWPYEEARAHLLMINCFCNSSMMVRRELVFKAGGLQSESRWGAEDYDFFERFSQISEISVLPEVLMHYRLWENYFTKIHRRKQMEDAFQISLRAVRRRLNNENFGQAAYRRFWYSYFEQEGLIGDEKTYLQPGDVPKLNSFFELIRRDNSLQKVWGHTLPRIFHLASDYPVASWGTGLIYQCVRLARQNGFEAFVLHAHAPFKIEWLEGEDIPICYGDDTDFVLRPDDILIVPEILIEEEFVLKAKCRKVVFIQNGFFISSHSEEPPDYTGLGYEAILVIMPHIKKIVQKLFSGLPVYQIPPYVAPYFYLYPEDLKAERKKQILLYPKKDSLDYDIFKKMLLRELSKAKGARPLGAMNDEPWEVIELKEMQHVEVALAMRQASFFVNLNTHEAFNSTVPEAMAAGCICLCYEAVGGQDFLRDGKNAFVYPNNHVYEVLEGLLALINGEEQNRNRLAAMRRNAYQTALEYQESGTRKALLDFYRRFLKVSKTTEMIFS